MAKQYILSFIIIASGVVSASARGPHHPRGDNVIKHHVHYRPTKEFQSDKITQDSELLHDKEHIREDIGDWIQQKDLDAMTDEELEFHYFNIHDFDRNQQLDGLEMLQAMRHTIEHDDEHHHLDNDDDDHQENADYLLYHTEFDYFIELVDKVLEEDDINNDGFLSYAEYVNAKRSVDKDKLINEIFLAPKLLT